MAFNTNYGGSITTVAFDGKTLAADTLITNGDHVFGRASKIHHLQDGRVLAASGAMDFIHAVIDWLNGGEKPVKTEDDAFLGILIYPNGSAKEISSQLRLWPACLPWAAGTGEQYALAAMRCGKDAIGAVEIAMQMDIYSGGEVESININQSPQAAETNL